MSCRRRGRAANPVDIIGDASPQRYEDAMRALLEDAATDALLVMNCPTALASSDAAASVVARETAAHKQNYPRKVVLTSWLGDGAAVASRRMFIEAHIPTFETPEAAVEGFMQLVRYRRAQDELMQVPPSASEAMCFDTAAVSAILRDALAAGRTTLSEVEAKALLASHGIPVVLTQIAADPAKVEAMAGEILKDHKACVVKVLSDDISHKSDVGGVRLALASARDARVAAEEILSSVRKLRPSAVIRGFTVQAMVERSACARADHRRERGCDRRPAHDVRRRWHVGRGNRRHRARAAAARPQARAPDDARDAHLPAA